MEEDHAALESLDFFFLRSKETRRVLSRGGTRFAIQSLAAVLHRDWEARMGLGRAYGNVQIRPGKR